MQAVLHRDVFKSTIYTYRTYDLFIVRIFIFIVSYLFIDHVFIQWITHFSVKIKEVMEWIGIKTDNDLKMFWVIFFIFQSTHELIIMQ